MNLRVIKKDIEYVINDFISDCLLFTDLHPDKNPDKVNRIVMEAVGLANTLFDKVNHPDKSGTVKLKTQYKAIYKELLTSVDGYYKRLSEIAKEK
ncbi:MAG: hypothetical protein LKK19_05725 [Bacteroidales bacterium]|jgi:hypothetical protein|nr:hypothetical protein [Bacteroidales bacterium]MCI2122184.1 hypothetical protein [Bacteroidales bacterium]MCI2145596.1 hypothetical protein [Bacteroidales bacterium]